MGTNVLDNVLSERWIEGHDGLAIGTRQADMVDEADVSVRTSVLYHKTSFP